MSPLSLLFSSDEETSRALSQALRELEFEVVSCPEIFGAIEKLTARSFDVIVSDWNEGLEAPFLLNTSRELESNKRAFRIAIAGADARRAAREAGADLALSKPIVSEQAKYALLTCDEFLAHMKTWLPKLGFQAAETVAARTISAPPVLPPQIALAPLPARPARPSPLPHKAEEDAPPVVPAFAFANGLFPVNSIPGIPSLNRVGSAVIRAKKRRGRFLPKAALGVAVISLVYAFSQPLRSQGMAISVAKICGRALQQTQAWLHAPDQTQPALPSASAESKPSRASHWLFGVTHIRVAESTSASAPKSSASPNQPAQPLQAAAQPSQTPFAKAEINIPASLSLPIQSSAVRNTVARFAPSLLAALEPVDLPAELAQKLLLQKVSPLYPEQAVRAGLQGSVVLQAWISRDGTIRELKLIRGSLLLGQAAYQAVRQWRYQPCVVDGRAVEAQTYVTVDFRLPQMSQSSVVSR